MEKYVTNIKDLVIQTLKNGSEIKAKAESGDAISCFQMGMIHLLGINTPIDFKKASEYFENQSLNDNPDASRLLGFIAEYESNYTVAFNYFAKAEESTTDKIEKSYISKVVNQRKNLLSFFNKIKLPVVTLNEEINSIFKSYDEGGSNTLEAKIKIAYICGDDESYKEVAKALYEIGDLYAAKSWLYFGKIDKNDSIFSIIDKKISVLKNELVQPYKFEVIDLDTNSFLINHNIIPSYANEKDVCDKATIICKQKWQETASNEIDKIKDKIEADEKARLKKIQDEEKARLKKIQDEENARLKKIQDEENARIKAEKEKIKKEKQAERLLRLKEQREIKRKKEDKKLIRNIVLTIVFFFVLFSFFMYEGFGVFFSLSLALAFEIGFYYVYLKSDKKKSAKK